MSTQPQRRYTLEEYLALERAAEVKYEYWQGEVFAIVSSPLTCGSRCQASHHTAYLKILAIFYGHGALMPTADLLNLGHYQGVDVYSWGGGVEF